MALVKLVSYECLLIIIDIDIISAITITTSLLIDITDYYYYAIIFYTHNE